MQDILTTSLESLTSPPILFFILGLFLGITKSDLKFPEAFSKILAVYLMMAIGFKGGMELSQSPLNMKLLYYSLLGVFFSLSLPFLGYKILRWTSGLKPIDCVAVAAHYGSVSVVTFVAALSFLDYQGIRYDRYLLLLLVLMEAPALFSALFLRSQLQSGSRKKAAIDWREIFLSGSIVLLVGSLFIGAISGKEGSQMVGDFLITPFKGVLCLFLLDMGITAGHSLLSFKKAGLRLALFGVYMPIIAGCLGVVAASLIGMDLGSRMLFAVLAASASYIVIPSALKISIPEANAGLYIPMSLGITFPFNVIFGIPLYLFLSRIVGS